MQFEIPPPNDSTVLIDLGRASIAAREMSLLAPFYPTVKANESCWNICKNGISQQQQCEVFVRRLENAAGRPRAS